jgi:uncharacterized protein YlaN (UPF0358 family)
MEKSLLPPTMITTPKAKKMTNEIVVKMENLTMRKCNLTMHKQ